VLSLLLLPLLTLERSTDTSPAGYGIGASPLLPVYIHHHVPHPADSSAPYGRVRGALTKLLPSASGTVDKLASLVSTSLGREPTPPPATLQYVLERRGVAVERNYELGTGLDVPLALDVSSPEPTPANRITEATLALRWSSEFVAARLSAACTSVKHRSTSPPPPKPIHHSTDRAGRTDSTITMKLTDVPAAKIHWNPRFTAIERPKNQEPVFATVEELVGTRGVDVSFSSEHSDGKDGVFMFLWEGETWRLAVHEVHADAAWNRAAAAATAASPSPPSHPVVEQMLAARRTQSSTVAATAAAAAAAAPGSDIRAHVLHLFGNSHRDPVLTADLVTGQMWLVDSLHVHLLDITVLLLGAVMNLEHTVTHAVERHAREHTNAVIAWRKEMEKVSIRCT